ncbi:MAG TPA: primosomal protein N' [Patescibacteria group bacterium]|nr:primosomal protein N' [Patescibacteria group bacterium]
MFVDIAVNTKSSKRDDLFTYSIPSELEKDILVGQMVMIPLGSRKVNGIIIKIHDKKPTFKTKDIEKIIEPIPIIDDKQVQLAYFISEHYWCGFSQALFHMIPANLRKRKTAIFKNLESKITNLGMKDKILASRFQLQLTSQQQKALKKINDALNSKKPATFLLHGVTNSGKTEVYLRAFAQALESGGSGIFIVPEISLTPQSLARFEEVFGKDGVALVHSQMSISQRLKTWIEIKTGKKKIVVGSRSAVFSPVKNLKIMIVDEEHDLISFKSDQTPRYELHTVAEKLAQLSGAVLVFGSGTPLVTSYKRVIDGEWEYLSISERVDGSLPPQIKVVNMEEEKPNGGDGIFSEYFIKALDMVLKNGKQALLFLNRRGMASFIICNDCKKISMCEQCDSALVFHSIDNKMWCHHCGRKYLPPTRCEICGGLDFRFLGKGTEKIEEEIKKYFPDTRIARMDRDTMIDDRAYDEIFEKYKKGEIDILVGTQMIVHGWDIPSVDLAAVISIDESLLIPDYTSEEKVYELVTQLAGRTGRSSARGLLVLQTATPDIWIFDTIQKGDYLSFVKRELLTREKFGYPPFGQLIKLSMSGFDRTVIEKKAIELFGKLQEIKNKLGEIKVEIIGPISPLVERKYGRYWKNIIIKTKNQSPFTKVTEDRENKKLIEGLLNMVPKEWVIDVDPISLL